MANRRIEYIVCKCKTCGKEFHPWSSNPNASFCSRACRNPKGFGSNSDHPYWKGSSSLTRDGVEITLGQGKTQVLHRLIAQSVLKRPLREGEVVHHANGNHRDNSLANLVLMKQETHSALHNYIKIPQVKGEVIWR